MFEDKIGFMASLGFGQMAADEVVAELKTLGYSAVEWTSAHFNPRTKSLAEQVSMLLDQIERGPGPLFYDDTVAEFAWRDQRLDELTNPPIPPGALKALSEHGTGIVTMGDLADFSKPSGDYLPALTDIKGIGPTAAGKIEAASTGFHEARMEDEKESPDDTDTPPDEDDDEPQGQEQPEQSDEQDEQDEQDDDDPDDPDADDAF